MQKDELPTFRAVGGPSTDDLHRRAKEMFYGGGLGRHGDAVWAARQTAKGRWPLLFLAILNTAGALFVIGMANDPLFIGFRITMTMVYTSAVVAMGYWIVWSWSLIAPFPASMVGFILTTCLGVLDFFGLYYAHAWVAIIIIQCLIFYLIPMVLLFNAVQHGATGRRLMQDLSAADAEDAARPRGIASALCLFLVIVFWIAVSLFLRDEPDEPPTFNELVAWEQILAVIVVIWAAFAWRDVLPAIRNFGGWVWNAVAVAGGFASFAFASLYLNVLNYVTKTAILHPMSTFRLQGVTQLHVIGLFALFPAYVEELAFRGIIVPCLNRAMSQTETIIVSAVMFMMIHLSIASAPHLLVLGLALGFIRLRSKSIWPCMLMHFTHNFLSLAMERWMF